MPLDGNFAGGLPCEMVYPLEVLLIFVLVTMGYYFGLIVHELGHVVAAWLCGV